jgi:hypothetical protein
MPRGEVREFFAGACIQAMHRDTASVYSGVGLNTSLAGALPWSISHACPFNSFAAHRRRHF